MAAHPRFAGYAGSYDAEISAANVGVVPGAAHAVRETPRSGPDSAMSSDFALRDTFCDPKKDNITQFFHGGKMGKRSTDLPGTVERNLGSGHGICSVGNYHGA